MKKTYIISSLIALSSFANAQSSAPISKADKANKASIERLKIIRTKFSNLPEAQRVKYLGLLSEAAQLFKNKRIFETLELIRQMEDIFKKNPQALNLKGACQVELRNFKAARTIFKEAVELAGPTSNVVFNLAEIDFVTDNWASAIKQFEQVLELSNANQVTLINLVNFKVLLCHIKLAEDKSLTKEKRAEHKSFISEYSKKVDKFEDSPYFYYANAAKFYYEGDKTKADQLLASVRRIYSQSNALLASWEDTLVEFGYIKSYLADDENSDIIPSTPQ